MDKCPEHEMMTKNVDQLSALVRSISEWRAKDEQRQNTTEMNIKGINESIKQLTHAVHNSSLNAGKLATRDAHERLKEKQAADKEEIFSSLTEMERELKTYFFKWLGLGLSGAAIVLGIIQLIVNI